MSSLRAPGLLPTLTRRLRPSSNYSIESHNHAKALQRPPPRVAFTSTARRRSPQAINRYGTANEPATRPESGKKTPAADVTAPQVALPKPSSPEQVDLKALKASGQEPEPFTASTARSNRTTNSSSPTPSDAPADATKSLTQPQPATSPSPILRMPPPTDTSQEEKPPHLRAPPYVHHFDTYTLVAQLQKDGGFSEAQAIETMKGVRAMLADNMDLARAGLVSRGDAEMATYLTRAASSELRTEIKQKRRTATEAQRSDRTALQHEVDVLSQRITQEMAKMRDELKGMFDDRKMRVRMEGRSAEGRIQELNYQITVALNSEMRSEIESLRFILTRRTVLALAGIVFMCLSFLRYASYAHARDEKKEKQRVAGLSLPQILPGIDAVEASSVSASADNPDLVNLG